MLSFSLDKLLEKHTIITIYSHTGFGYQKVVHNLAAGKLHKVETAFVTLEEN